jgi:hypothetical protein
MIKKFIPNTIIRILIYLLLIVPTGLFLLVTLGYFAYLFWPHDLTKITAVELDRESQHIVLTAHGVKDSPNNWGVPLLAAINSHSPANHSSANIDWRPYSDNPLICSVVAKRIGEAIAERIVAETKIKSIHAIGHSCGAFIIYGISQRIESLQSDIRVQTTFLDPVSIYAGVFWNYGIENFGRFAEFSDAYIDTEDGVPGSNKALSHSVTFDVTKIKHDRGLKIAPHNWPPHYYIGAYKSDQVLLLSNDNQQLSQLPKGELIEPKDS